MNGLQQAMMQPEAGPEIRIACWLTENVLAQQFIDSLSKRRLDEKFFYWSPLSVLAWLELCGDGPYRNFARSKSLVSQTAEKIAATLAPGPVEVVSLGSGQGDKDLLLLQAIRKVGQTPAYVPVDSSQALLEMACKGAADDEIPSWGIKADFTEPGHLRRLRSSPPPRPGSWSRNNIRLIMMLGNTVGCMDPLAGVKQLAAMLGPNDYLLADAELASEESISGYDNPVNRRFAWAPLNSIGISEDQGELTFEQRADTRMEGLHFITKYFLASTNCEALISGRRFAIRQGERVDMSFSYKYSEAAFSRIIREAGLRDVMTAVSGDGRFIVALLRQQ